MATQRTDRTGQTHGALHVLALSAHDGRKWWVRWECCGSGELLDSMVISYSAKHPPTCCKVCAKAGQVVVLEPTPKPPPAPRPTQKPDFRDCAEAARAQDGVYIHGRGWWPVLQGPMGPRHGMSWKVYERRMA